MQNKSADEARRAHARADALHAINRLLEAVYLRGDVEFDAMADAAETLTRAANRVAPEGHRLRFERVE